MMKSTPILILTALIAIFYFRPAGAAAEAQTRYVAGGGSNTGDCTDSGSPCRTITYAISQAVSGDTIIVAQGTYQENLVLTTHIDLYGGFDAADWQAAPTPYGSIINGNHLDSVVRYEVGSGGVLDGFKITGGLADLGGGIYGEESDLHLQNLWIVGNEALDSGGGVYITQSQSAIVDSKVENNQAANFGGGMHLDNSSSAIEGLEAEGNTAVSGGAISLNNTGKITLKASRVRGNLATGQSGAVHAVDTLFDIEESVIAGNQAGDHGGVMTAEGALIKIINSLFYDNHTGSGVAGIMAVDTSTVIATNSTFADNAPDGDQAVLVWNESSALILKNSIMWNNSLNLQADPPCDSCFSVSYSDVQGYSGGDSNIDADPRFRSPQTADYRLLANSPCIDAGTSTGAPSFDLDGTLRDAEPDMGAYEYIAVKFDYANYLPAVVNYEG